MEYLAPLMKIEVIRVVLIVVLMLITMLIASVPFRSIWNAAMPDIFGLKRLTWKQSWNLLWVFVSIVIFSAIGVLFLKMLLGQPLK